MRIRTTFLHRIGQSVQLAGISGPTKFDDEGYADLPEGPALDELLADKHSGVVPAESQAENVARTPEQTRAHLMGQKLTQLQSAAEKAELPKGEWSHIRSIAKMVDYLMEKLYDDDTDDGEEDADKTDGNKAADNDPS